MNRRNSTNLSLLMSELCSFFCLKLYSLNFAIAHAQKRLLCLCLRCITIFDNFLSFAKSGKPISTSFLPLLEQ